jgi:probable rRNA maturation factor
VSPSADGPAVDCVDRRTTDDTAVDVAACCDLLSAVLAAEGVAQRATATILLLDPDEIASLAAEHLGHEGPTDVLSFPIDGAVPVAAEEPWVVGDVVLCPQVAASGAPTHAGDLPSELALLVTHGGLHLCGWDHPDRAREAAMWARERELLERHHGPLAGDPWATAGTGGVR